MKIDKTKTNSIRKAFGKTLAEIGELNEKIIVMDADLACSTQTKIFADKFPDRFFDCGIAEQNMLATAAGLASEGKILLNSKDILIKLYIKKKTLGYYWISRIYAFSKIFNGKNKVFMVKLWM